MELTTTIPTTNDITNTANSRYIDSTEYKNWTDKIKECISVMDELTVKSSANRKLRYAEVDIEAMRKDGHLAPDELYIPRHIIDSNVRREQSSYVQYASQSPRAVILQDKNNPNANTASLEHDVTTRLRFDKWQTSMYSCIDAMQQNGYGIMEVVQNLTQPGELAHEHVQLGDFSFVMDTRDLQETEMVMRAYYFTKTRLINMTKLEQNPFDAAEVEKIVQNKATVNASTDESLNTKEKSLYKIHKVMFRVKGVVHVAWCASERCDKWLRAPLPLFLGRRKMVPPPAVSPLVGMLGQSPVPAPNSLPQSVEDYETNYPYFISLYLISENNTISQSKGRVYLDQDSQEATSSLLSSFCTGHRRASGLYFSKDVSDPNDDIMMQKDIFFKTGALINGKVTQFQLRAPDAEMASAIMMVETMNQNETSQVNFAVNNRKDSRKTAKEIGTAEQQQQQLSTVQVVLFSTFLKEMYSLMFAIIQSRVVAGLIEVSEDVKALYAGTYIVKPSGDSDVIERQQRAQVMMNAWPVMQNTPANVAFLSDLISLLFPETGQKYIQIFQQAQQQQQSAQAQAQQQAMSMAQGLAKQVVELSKHPEMFSEIGHLHALPVIQGVAKQIEDLQSQQAAPKQLPQGAPSPM